MNHNCQREYDFALVLSGITELFDGIEDRLFEAGCDDATLSVRNGRVTLTFARLASSHKEAILSAIRDVRKADIGAGVLRVDSCNLVTQSEIARKIDRPRQVVHQYVTGERGPGGFPGPACNLSEESPLWSWCEVATWLWENNFLKEEVLRQAREVAAINSMLELIEQKHFHPEFMEELVTFFEDEWIEDCVDCEG